MSDQPKGKKAAKAATPVDPAAAEAAAEENRRTKRLNRFGHLQDIAVETAMVERARTALFQADPDIGEDAEAFRDTLDGMTSGIEIMRAAGNRWAALDDMEAELEGAIKGLEAQIKKRKARRDRIAAQKAAIAELGLDLLTAMTPPGQKVRMEDGLFSCFKVQPPETQRKLVIVDETAIPDDYRIPQDPIPDNARIKQALLDKKDIPGATLSNVAPARLQFSQR